MNRSSSRRGSILIMALWIIAVLSVMVVSFAFEARQQAGIDIYVRERNRVRRLIDSGRVLGEAVLLGYKDAPEPEMKSGEPDWKDAFEEDRWCVEKHALKSGARKCTIGPLCLEEREEGDEESEPATITVELRFDGAEAGIDINSLCAESGGSDNGSKKGAKGGGGDSCDKEYVQMWRAIFRECGIDDELEVEVEDADRSGTKKHNLMNLLIASWLDWRDSNDTVSKGPLEDDSDYRHDPQEDDGAEKSWYEERDEKDEIPVRDRRVPANGRIKKLEELSYIRGFRDFPSVLTGGHLYDGTSLADKFDKNDENNPTLTGIMSYFKLSGGPKLALNDTTRRRDLNLHLSLLITDLDDASEQEDMNELADSILAALWEEPEDADDRVPEYDPSGRKWWPYKDFEDLRTRVDDYGCDVEVPQELSERLQLADSSSGSDSEGEKFSMTITGESMGMKYVVKARCIISDKKVQYIEWSENEGSDEDKKEKKK